MSYNVFAGTINLAQSNPIFSVASLSWDWNCRSGRPCHTWLLTIESYLILTLTLTQPLTLTPNSNPGLAAAWSMLVGTAASITGQATQ